MSNKRFCHSKKAALGPIGKRNKRITFANYIWRIKKNIVNTHSPVLLRWLKEEYNDTDNGVSIWFSKLISYPIDINGNKRSIRISRISPLTKSFQLSFSEAENKMTIADAIAYLNTENQNL